MYILFKINAYDYEYIRIMITRVGKSRMFGNGHTEKSFYLI